jgi:hypothetical protein
VDSNALDRGKLVDMSNQTNPRSTRLALCVVIALVLLVLFPDPAQSASSRLRDATLAAWDDYVRAACARNDARLREQPFLQVRQFPSRLKQVREGEIAVWGKHGDEPVPVPHGLIHDWDGAVFIPKATMADVLAVVRNYDEYAQIYQPAVIEAKSLANHGDDDKYSMLLMHKALFVTAALQGEYETRYVQVDPQRWYSTSQSTRLQAVKYFGQPERQLLPPDQGPGYVWRLYSFVRFEQSDGGVYVEMEALGLSRDIPAVFRWLVQPILEHLPKESIETSLEETRDAVLKKIGAEQ